MRIALSKMSLRIPQGAINYDGNKDYIRLSFISPENSGMFFDYRGGGFGIGFHLANLYFFVMIVFVS